MGRLLNQGVVGRMTRERLSQLSQEDLFYLVDIFDVDLTEIEETDRVQLEQLLFETIEEIRRDRETDNTFPISYHEQKFDSLDELFGTEISPNQWGFDFPASYNVTRIELMLRDPAWVFCYWDISIADKTRILKEENFQNLLLRLEEVATAKPAEQLQIMEVPVQLTDSSWYLNLLNRETFYRIHLVADFNGKEEILATSQKVQVPRGGLTEKLAVMDSFETDALIALSGIEKLGVAGFDKDIPQRILNITDKWED